MITEKEGAIVISVRVIPRAARTEILGEYSEALKIKVTSPPVEGAANSEIIKLLARQLKVTRSAVAIVSGGTSRTKQIRIAGVTAAEARKRLGV